VFKNLFLTLVVLLWTFGAYAQTTSTVTTDSKSNSTVTTDADTKTIVISPPPSAITPGVNGSNSDLCTVGVAGAVQTQILGISSGETVRDPNCERLKLSKTLYDMGMKVAAVSVLCQDRRVFDAMKMAGTPCPYLGTIGQAAQDNWDENPEKLPEPVVLETKDDVQKRNGAIAATGISIGLLLLLLL
tara:strand:+ start:470 stop:1030 length:561 start_codon:yes stop_codon:yes gene_type:complete